MAGDQNSKSSWALGERETTPPPQVTTEHDMALALAPVFDPSLRLSTPTWGGYPGALARCQVPKPIALSPCVQL